jgi:hypothetical protein
MLLCTFIVVVVILGVAASAHADEIRSINKPSTMMAAARKCVFRHQKSN